MEPTGTGRERRHTPDEPPRQTPPALAPPDGQLSIARSGPPVEPNGDQTIRRFISPLNLNPARATGTSTGQQAAGDDEDTRTGDETATPNDH